MSVYGVMNKFSDPTINQQFRDALVRVIPRYIADKFVPMAPNYSETFKALQRYGAVKRDIKPGVWRVPIDPVLRRARDIDPEAAMTNPSYTGFGPNNKLTFEGVADLARLQGFFQATYEPTERKIELALDHYSQEVRLDGSALTEYIEALLDRNLRGMVFDLAQDLWNFGNVGAISSNTETPNQTKNLYSIPFLVNAANFFPLRAGGANRQDVLAFVPPNVTVKGAPLRFFKASVPGSGVDVDASSVSIQTVGGLQRRNYRNNFGAFTPSYADLEKAFYFQVPTETQDWESPNDLLAVPRKTTSVASGIRARAIDTTNGYVLNTNAELRRLTFQEINAVYTSIVTTNGTPPTIAVVHPETAVFLEAQMYTTRRYIQEFRGAYGDVDMQSLLGVPVYVEALLEPTVVASDLPLANGTITGGTRLHHIYFLDLNALELRLSADAARIREYDLPVLASYWMGCYYVQLLAKHFLGSGMLVNYQLGDVV